MRTPVMATLLLMLAVAAARADMENLQQFLHAVEETTQVAVPLRGDGEFEVTAPDATRRDQMALILRQPRDVYIELHQEGSKLLLPSAGTHAYSFTKGATKPDEVRLDTGFAGSDFTREDLEPFRLSRFKDWRISDESGPEMTVTLFPGESQYSLVVITFDRDKKVPVKTLYYRETLNNLVKMRRDDGYVLIGRKWMPTTITMETFKLRTHSRFTLRWTQDARFPPELFDQAFLTRPAAIVWPTVAPTPAP